MKERTAKAKATVEGVDLSMVEPAKCMAWARLYQAAQMRKEMGEAAQRFMTSNPAPAQYLSVAQFYQQAQMPKEMQALAQKFVDSNPEPKLKFTGQQLVMQGMLSARDAEGVVKLLGEMKPPTPQAAVTLAAASAGSYSRMIADKLGVKAALDLIDRMEAQVPFDELRKAEASQPAPPDGQPAVSQAEYAISNIAIGRAELLEKDGKKDEALQILQTARAKLKKGSPYARGLNNKLTFATLPGSIAPELKQERGYGGFTSLESMRGKVVIVDFTAHW